MKSITASGAKQNFGALLADAAQGPVRIVRHGKTVAAVVPATWLDNHGHQPDHRAAARAAQQARELAREDKHRRVALALLLASPKKRKAMVQEALRVVDRWQNEHLCSSDYIDRWRTWLQLPAAELSKAMTSTDDPWGRAMRQNSPFATFP